MPDRRWKIVGPPVKCQGVLRDNIQAYIFDNDTVPFDGPFDVNSEFNAPTQDLPSTNLNADQISSRGNDRFYVTTMMFKSAQTGAQWVPIYTAVWSWKYCCCLRHHITKLRKC